MLSLHSGYELFFLLALVGSYRVNISIAQGDFDEEHINVFCYNNPQCGPLTWPGVCQAGARQSPINLPYVHCDHVRNASRADLIQGPNFFKEHKFILTNNGHTVQAALTGDLTSTITLDGSLLKGQRYVFSQLHFHWGSSDDRGSEHTLSGERYPLEAHLVHYSADYSSFTEALNSNRSGSVAVIGVFFHIGDGDSRSLAPIITALNTMQSTSVNTITGDNLNLSLFLCQSHERNVDVIQYSGSLTTPTCNEGVFWNIIPYPVPISASQMDGFRKLKVPHTDNFLLNNFRPLQARNGREIFAAVTSIQ